MEQTEKLELYKRAKQQYYTGEPIMGDAEFDALENELGLNNKGFVGTRHNPSYTIEHPFVMGSLSKVQIKEDENGVIEWQTHYNEAKKYFGENEVILTPKFDGCSWELLFDSEKISISSRGDGTYGKDLLKHLKNKFDASIVNAAFDIATNYNSTSFTLRGECLVDKDVFNEKYADKFVNPRSFVAGVLNREYEVNDKEFMDMLNDISIMIYDFRVKENNNKWIDLDWIVLSDISKTYNDINSHTINVVNEICLPYSFPEFHIILDNLDEQKFIDLYSSFSTYRDNYHYALDGIVIKPTSKYRINNTTETRPKDCVAIKFVPMLTETEVTEIVWQLGKTGEMIPVINFTPIELDGKIITKCSGHNYGTLISKKVSVGTKIVVRLAGDIIPDLYRITDTTNYSEDKINIPDNCIIDGVHLMAVLNEHETNKNAFLASANSLNIPSIGPKIAENIYNYVTKNNGETDEFFDEKPVIIDNILLISNENDIYFGAGAGKLGKNSVKAYKETIEKLTLTDIIDSCNFRFCGKTIAEQISNYLLHSPYSFEHCAADGYKWVYDTNSKEFIKVMKILAHLGNNIDDFKHTKIENSSSSNDSQIPIIMTGEPNDYSTKAEFLQCHPEYKQTTSWKEVKIVFTNDVDSNTGKMKKAKDKNIEIRVY